jgi:hypothetical protein
MTTSRNHRRGLAALATAGTLDLFSLLALGGPDSAPVGVILLSVCLGVVTLVGVAAAWRGNRRGLVAAVLARVVDSALTIPAFFLDAPAWVRALVIAMLALTAVGIWFVAPDLRRASKLDYSTRTT